MGRAGVTDRIVFHVPPDASPVGVRALLAVIDGAEAGPMTRASWLHAMASYVDTRPRGEVLGLAEATGMVARRADGLQPTVRAYALARTEARNDLIHAMQYFGWSGATPGVNGAMWTYRTVTDLLWQQAPVRVDAQLKKRVAEEVLARAAQVFEGTPGFDAARTSVGPKTVEGVARWIAALAPPGIADSTAQRRQTCPPGMIVLALAGVMRQEGAVGGTDFRLSAEGRETVCRCCFLESENLDRMLEWTVSALPHAVTWGTLRTSYGRQVVLTQTDPGPEHLV